MKNEFPELNEKKNELHNKAGDLPSLNEKGNILIIIVIGILIVLLIPVVLSAFFWPVKLVLQLVLIFSIYTTVRSFLGDNPIAIVISAVLIYLLAFKWFYIASTAYIFIFLMSIGFTSAIVWGIGMTFRQH